MAAAASSRRRPVKLLAATVLLALAATACDHGDGTSAGSSNSAASDDPASHESSRSQSSAVHSGDDAGIETGRTPVAGSRSNNNSTPIVHTCGSDEFAELFDSFKEYVGFDLMEYLPSEWCGNLEQNLRIEYLREQERLQELMVACVADEGYEYVPQFVPWVNPLEAIVEFARADDLLEYARDHGFDFTTSWSYGDDSDWTAPDLSEGELDEMLDRSLVELDCSVSLIEVLEDEGALDEVAELLQLVFSALPVVDPFATDGAWSQCMRDSGHYFEDRDAIWGEVFDYFWDRRDEITAEATRLGLEAQELWSVAAAMQDGRSAPVKLNDRAVLLGEKLAALQAEERTIAVADAECMATIRRQLMREQLPPLFESLRG